MKSYDAERSNYRVEVPERFNPVLDILEKWSVEIPPRAGAGLNWRRRATGR